MINIDQARALLKQAMETQGRDFVYNPEGGGDCFYEKKPNLGPDDPRSKTACLIGVALDLAGETFHHRKSGNIFSLVCHDIMTFVTVEYFSLAQIAQDHGKSWGEAYDKAEEYYNRIKENL